MLQVHLDREAIVNAGGLVSEEWRGAGNGRSQQKTLTIHNIKLDDHQTGSITLFPSDLLADIPAILHQFVHEVSYYDNFGYGLTPHRRIGLYRLASATADLHVVGGSSSHYHVKIRAKNMADLRELHQLIRQGQIWPALDYDAEQVPPPYRHLRDLVSEAWQLVRRDARDRLFRIRERVLG